MRQVMLVVFASLALGGQALAEDLTKLEVTIKDHRFDPAEIHVPAGKPALLIIHNADETPEEFESSALKLEKVVPGNTSASMRLRPLGAGRFPFIGEYHADTAQGAIIADQGSQP